MFYNTGEKIALSVYKICEHDPQDAKVHSK